MAFEQLQYYIYRFTLPDGEHVGEGIGCPSMVRGQYGYVHAHRLQNPEFQSQPHRDLIFNTDRNKHVAMRDAIVAELAARYPERATPTELSLENFGDEEPIRVITNPSIVPGSTLKPAE